MGLLPRRSTPGQEPSGATDWSSVRVGYDVTCGEKNTDRVFCWGSTGEGSMGDGTGLSAVPLVVP